MQQSGLIGSTIEHNMKFLVRQEGISLIGKKQNNLLNKSDWEIMT